MYNKQSTEKGKYVIRWKVGSATGKGKVSRLRGIPRGGSIVSNMVAKWAPLRRACSWRRSRLHREPGRCTLQAEGRASAKALRQEHARVFKEEKDAGRWSKVSEGGRRGRRQKGTGDQITEGLVGLCEDGLLF